MQAEAVHNVIDSYSKALPTGLKISDGVVDTAMALKQQVPVDYDMLALHCAEDVGRSGVIQLYMYRSKQVNGLNPPQKTESFCPGLGSAETRNCLNQQFGSRVLSHECLKVILPRGALDLQIPNLSRFGEYGLIVNMIFFAAHQIKPNTPTTRHMRAQSTSAAGSRTA